MNTKTSFLVLLLCSCGSDNGLMNTGDGGHDLAGTHPADLSSQSGNDLAGSTDMAMTFTADAGISCGAMTCMSPNVCCVTGGAGGVTTSCMPSCPDGGATVSCSGPEFCMGNPCCATITNMSIAGVMCTAAMTDCPGMLNFTTGSGDTRLCHVDADCTRSNTGTTFTNCCTFMQGGQTAHGCFDPAFAALSGGRVTCP